MKRSRIFSMGFEEFPVGVGFEPFELAALVVPVVVDRLILSRSGP